MENINFASPFINDPSKENDELAVASRRIAELEYELEVSRRESTYLESSLNGLQLQFDGVSRRIARSDQSVIESYRQLAQVNQELQALRGQRLGAEQMITEMEYLQKVVESAKRWQDRSWVKRAFHKWTPPARKGSAPLDLEALRAERSYDRAVDEQKLEIALGVNNRLRTSSITCGIVARGCLVEEMDLCLKSVSLALDKIKPEVSGTICLSSGTLKSKLEDLNVHKKEYGKEVPFAGVQNLMMKEAFSEGADYYLIVHPRGSCDFDALKALILHEQVGDQPTLIDAIQFPTEHSKGFDIVQLDTPFALTTCLLIPKKIYETIGGLDERLDPFFAGVDFSWRARNQGFDVKTCPRALYFHPIGRTEPDPKVVESYLVSGIVFAKKFGSRGFEKRMRAQAILNDVQLPAIPEVEPVSTKMIRDFDQGFSGLENGF